MLPGTDFIGYRSAILIFSPVKQVSSIRSDVKADSGICIAIRLMKILFSSQEAEYAQNENSSHHRHQKLCRLKPLMEPPMPNMVASQPPTTAPTIPRIQVRKNPPPSRPGMISLAIMPAIRSKIIQGNNSHVQALVSMNRTQEMLTSTL